MGYIQERFRHAKLRPWQQKLHACLMRRYHKQTSTAHNPLYQRYQPGSGANFFMGYLRSHYRKYVIILPSTGALAYVQQNKRIVSGGKYIFLHKHKNGSIPWEDLQVLKEGFISPKLTIEPPVICIFARHENPPTPPPPYTQ